MNRFSTLFVTVLFLLFITIMAGALNLGMSSDITTGIPTTQPSFLESITSYLTVFWNIITFQVSGLPAIVTAILFYPVSFMIFFYIISVIRGI